MRLTDRQAETIVRLTKEVFGPEAQIRLFGSRINDTIRGGDIDLLVQTSAIVNEPALAAARLEARLIRELGLQKIDVLISAPNLSILPIHAIAAKGVLL